MSRDCQNFVKLEDGTTRTHDQWQVLPCLAAGGTGRHCLLISCESPPASDTTLPMPMRPSPSVPLGRSWSKTRQESLRFLPVIKPYDLALHQVELGGGGMGVVYDPGGRVYVGFLDNWHYCQYALKSCHLIVGCG